MVAIHLLVLIHGMWGNPQHLSEAARIVQEIHSEPSAEGTKLHLLMAEAIKEDSTYDGIDWGGERIAKEVLETVQELEGKGDQVVRFSVTGYSLGGLIARYCIGVLHQQGFFEKVEPVNFNTIATPHCGLPRYQSFFSSLTQTLGPKLLSRTGEQFYCVDKWSPRERPLLVVMADPDRIFYQALSKFKHIRIYANAINDITVPYVTAAIQTIDPFADYKTSGIEIEFNENYACLVQDYALPSVPPPKPPKPTMFTAEWFQTIKPSRPLLPPFLQFRFPFNLALYALLPILIPTFFSLALVRLSLATRSSRARIKLLEKEAHNGDQRTLVELVAELEQEMEEAVVDLIDNPDPSPLYQSEVSKEHPIITAYHRQIANWLNTLPIKKELAYFPGVRNAHAMIISRDVKQFEIHRLGEPVLRHWATSFIL
ncbi:putative serine esterase-domain-containing protein [Gymnopilus junonius]|uniref:Serine esterase-domain-containing protein n=1 Tax=Gymnopilus junonius TaxID=109634 RepID=A0A9P5TQY5_GYMJU|nr:putative serine esterase-domain-containing protein [Gymnopilus junonius]